MLQWGNHAPALLSALPLPPGSHPLRNLKQEPHPTCRTLMDGRGPGPRSPGKAEGHHPLITWGANCSGFMASHPLGPRAQLPIAVSAPPR